MMWFAWHGGWCWGPRLIIPGLVPAIAALGPWLVGSHRRRAAALLFVLGFAISLPAVIVSTQAQQLGAPRVPAAVLRAGHFLPTQPLASPSPWRQLQLVGPIARYSLEHRYKGRDDGRNYLRYLSLWQLGLTRRLQYTGLLASLIGTAALLFLGVISGGRVRAALQEIVRTDGDSFAAEPGSLGERPPNELDKEAFQLPNPPVHAGDGKAE
jgi:hypothetical protein